MKNLTKKQPFPKLIRVTENVHEMIVQKANVELRNFSVVANRIIIKGLESESSSKEAIKELQNDTN